MTDPFAAERQAVEISVAINLLLDYGFDAALMRPTVEKSINLPERRMIMSLVPRLWPDPDQCPDQC